MNRTAVRRLGYSIIVVAATAILSGCADEPPLGPDRGSGSPAPLVARSAATQVDAVATAAASSAAGRAADLGTCDSLQVPAGSKLAVRLYAEGVQIYHWNGTAWIFDGPLATLSADQAGTSTVGNHYAGPTWESLSGSKVVGAVLKRCIPDPTAIPWLLLRAVSSDGPGIFDRVTYIQRLNTVGGNAPANPGSFTGEEARVPYTTEYLFYRAQ